MESSLKLNFIYNVGYQLLVIILPLITTPYISRVLGAEKLGIYSYTYSVANYFVLFLMLGVANYGNRSIAQVKDNRNQRSERFWSIYGFQLFRGIVIIVAYLIYSMSCGQRYLEISLLQSFYVLSGLLDISWFFFGIEKFKLTVLRNAMIRIANLLLIFLLVKDRTDLWKYTLIMSLGTVFSQGYLWFYIKKYVDFKKTTIKDIIPHIKPELILFVPIIAISLYRIMDKIMLGQLSSMTQVGYYQNAEKIVNIPMSIITALGTVMLPRMSNLTVKGDKKLGLLYIENSMLFVCFMGTAFAFGLSGVAPILAPVFLGKEYYACSILISYLAITTIFLSWANVIRTQYLIPNQMDVSYIISVSLGAVTNLIANALLIPHFQALGAVVGTILAEFVVCVSQTLRVRKYLDIKKYLKAGWPFLPIGFVMFYTVRKLGQMMGENIKTLVVEIMVGVIVYIVFSFLYLYVIKHPIIMSEKNKRSKK